MTEDELDQFSREEPISLLLAQAAQVVALQSIFVGEPDELHADEFSHNIANRYLAGDEIRPRLVLENVNTQVIQTF